MWDKSDQDAFHYHTNISKIGQITTESNFGKLLLDFASNPFYKRFLEIGTWNGLGSTMCFHKGFQIRSSSLNDHYKDCFLDSLEINREKAHSAMHHYKDYPNIRVHHATLVNYIPEKDDEDEVITWERVVKDLDIKTSDHGMKKWFDTDTINLVDCPVFEPSHSMDEHGYLYDVVLLDGGEFTTFYEFEKLRHVSKVIICDDINTYKCSRVCNILLSDERWIQLVHEPDDRNGYCVFVRKQVSK